VQVDEKWSFVGKKQKNCDRCDPADDRRGDCWDHVALDPDSRLVLEVLVGPRTGEMAEALLEGVHKWSVSQIMSWLVRRPSVAGVRWRKMRLRPF
jgi:hypothetical protein